MNADRRLLLGLILCLLGACSSRQAYDSAQAWQRQQCLKLPDDLERARCLEQTTTTYEDYRRQRP